MDILNLIKQLTKNALSLSDNILQLAQLELMLAKKSLPVVAGLVFVIFILITSLWVFLITLLLVYLRTHGIHFNVALFWVIGIHILLILISALALRSYLNHFKFATTRKHLKSASHKMSS
jgi:hypothetical protein